MGGWRPGTGNCSGTVGALLLGIPRESGLNYVGRVGTWFTARDLNAAHSLLKPLRSPQSPLVTVPPADARDAQWVNPLLVGEVRFREWTAAGWLRHPSWRGWRTDKRATDVRIEPSSMSAPDRFAP